MSPCSWIDEVFAHLGFRPNDARSIPPSEVDLAKFESSIGASLPADYRYVLTSYAGGRFGDQHHRVLCPIAEPCPGGNTVQPMEFYPLIEARKGLESMQLPYLGRIPSGVLAISGDLGGNQICLDVAGATPGTVWFWDHEQSWFTGDVESAAKELDAAGVNATTLSVHGIIRAWARLHAERFDRPADYLGMYRIAPSFADFLHSLYRDPR